MRQMHNTNRRARMRGIAANGRVRVRMAEHGLFFNMARYISAVCWGLPINCQVMPWWPLSGSLYAGGAAMAAGDTWDQFFERIDHTWEDAKACRRTVKYGHTKRSCPISLKAGRFPRWYEAIKPRNDASEILGVPHRHAAAAAVIDKHVKLKPAISDHIDDVYARHLSGKHVIGAHIRGPGRYHDGTLLLNWYCEYNAPPPYEEYAKRIEKHLRPDSVVLLCTDAGCVQEHFKARWGDQVFCTVAQPGYTGEPHERAEQLGADPYQLGVQALTDAYLLARADVFVYGCSNMTNYVICMAPETPAEDIYAQARRVDFSKLPRPADTSIIEEWVANDPTKT